MTSTTNFTAEAAKAALSDVLTALEVPENVQKLNAAKENSGNEMLKTMQFVFPTVMQIQMEVIKKYGFPDGREGAVQFAQFIRSLEKDDTEVAKLHAQVRSYFLPSVPVNSSTDASL
ncbi:hypothetical protein TSAR_007580 [Trichomalopsis sarcophagae]|uniref:Protein C10 n=1 Tax=Trichomalopsis sarcophagae TaxID=543379 RepID=A0A232FAQ0_9HYME|nr:hypothetical protein TSAR_007580 [Trichomalopsis sarcophagae]